MSAGAVDIHALAAARVGQVLRGKWRLDGLLGVGGSACVYAATHRNGKRGAVKLLRPELATNDEVKRRFLREGYVANRIEHRGAVAVLDDDTAEDGSVFLVMELLEGQTLEDYARARTGGRISPSDAALVVDNLLDVLAAAHDKGIVHRDLKPENVFLTVQGEVKILDFGTARVNENSSVGRMTEVGHIMGTPAFMPPEQALGHNAEIDGRTDLWAVGAILYYVLSGKLVHSAETVNKVLLSAMTQQAPPLGSIVPEVPRELSEVVDRALMFQRDKRWSDARAMQRALRSARQSLPATSPFLPMSRTTAGRSGAPLTANVASAQDAFEPSTQGNRRVVMVAVGLLTVVALGAVIAFAASKPSSAPTATSNSAAPMAGTVAATPAPEPPAPSPPSASAAPSSSAALPADTSRKTNVVTAAAPTTPLTTPPTTTKPAPTSSTSKPAGTKDIFSTW